MAATISAVAASNPEGLTAAAGRLSTSVSSLQSQIATQQAGLTELQGGWEGQAATAALSRGQQDLQRQQQFADKLGTTQAALSSAGTNLAALRTEIQNVTAQATSLGGVVADDGTVTPSGTNELMTPTLAAAYTTSLQNMLTQFDAVDEQTAGDIQLAFGPDGEGAETPPPPPEEKPIEELEPPDGATDTEVNQWWDGLSKEEQDRLIVEKPDWIGNLDGVPGTARDAANRNRLGTLRNDPNLTDEEKATITQIDAALAEGDRQLLLVDFDGDHPKVAVAVGNVDTADHVSVYVPGTGATPWKNPDPTQGNDLPTYMQQATWLKSDTEQLLDHANKNETVATVIWMGYEPPSNVFQAASPHYADDNAPELASFVNGIDSSRDNDPHLTVLGHSYGSTLASEALQRGTAADDVVFMGSPGLETNVGQFYDDVTPADLHLSEGHVYVQEARGDAVAGLGRYGASAPADLPGFTELSTYASDTPLGRREDSWWHSAYSMAGTTALYNQAVVVAGLGQDDRFVRTED